MLSHKLQVEILDFMIDEIEDTNDLLLEGANTSQNDADRSKFTETKISEGRTRFGAPNGCW